MKNTVQKTVKQVRQAIDFQAFVICPKKQKDLKGGEDIIITDVVEG